MADTYLFAAANLFLCSGIVFVAICRLNTMRGKSLMRVRSEYACYLAAALTSAVQPWYGEWPGWASLAMAGAALFSLLASGHAWRDGPPCNTEKASTYEP